MRICENRLCGIQFEPDISTLNQPPEKQQRFCGKDCREQVYQKGRYRIVPECTVEISWPLLKPWQKTQLEPYLIKSQGYGTVISTNDRGDTVVSIAGEEFTLYRGLMVRL